MATPNSEVASSGQGPEEPTDDATELPDELLEAVAGGGNPPTNTVESTGSVKSN